jgi:uncharacterized protein (DUF1697 family)
MRFVVFMRAVNVRGHAQVRMADVRDAFAAAGCANVSTFIQSGNVLFDASSREAAGLVRRARANVGGLMNEDPVFILRTLDEIEHLVRSDPFGLLVSDHRLKLYVAFLSRVPARIPAPLPISEKERLSVIAIEERAAFIVSRHKDSGFYGMPNNFIEAALGVAATCRNWSTVSSLATRFAVLPPEPGRVLPFRGAPSHRTR